MQWRWTELWIQLSCNIGTREPRQYRDQKYAPLLSVKWFTWRTIQLWRVKCQATSYHPTPVAPKKKACQHICRHYWQDSCLGLRATHQWKYTAFILSAYLQNIVASILSIVPNNLHIVPSTWKIVPLILEIVLKTYPPSNKSQIKRPKQVIRYQIRAICQLRRDSDSDKKDTPLWWHIRVVLWISSYKTCFWGGGPLQK